MKVTDIKLIDPKKITNATAVKLYEKLKKKTEGFNDDFLEVFDEEVLEFVNLIKTNLPQAFKPEAGEPKPPRTPKPRTPRTPTPTPPMEEGGDDLVSQVMEDYKLTRDKALRLIALRIEADELKKENFEKLVDRLDKSEFYEGKNRISRSPIDKGRTRDLGKDSKQGALTSAEERKMTGTPFKRISKAGKKNQYGTTEGNKVYYEYRQNRRDVDNKIKLATGGVLGQDVTYKYYDEQPTGTILEELPNGYAVSTKWGTRLVTPNDVISITAPKKKRFSFFKKGGGINVTNERVVKFGTLKNSEFSRKIHSVEFYYNTYEFESNTYEIEISKTNGKITVEEPDEYANPKFKKGGGVGIPNADKMFHLPYEIAVYVPSTKDVDKNISPTELRARVKEVEKYLAETFGGFTSSEKVGGYLSSKSSIVTEKVVPVTAFSSLNDFKANKSKLINKISVLAKKWGQEAIGFEFEGDLYYVPQKFKTGGTLKATYIPRRDIKLLTTVWGNNIKGKDLIDGAYTKRKDIKTAPKVARTQFEDETFEYKKGGKLDATYIPKRDIKSIETIWGNKISGKDLLDGAYTKRTNIKSAPKVARTMFEDETFEYKNGGVSDELQDPKKLYALLNEAEVNWSKDNGAEYNRIGALIKQNRKNYYNLLNNAEVNWSKDNGAEYKRLLSLQKIYYAKGGRIDLFEDYENIPSNVQKVLDKYAEKFGDDYSGMSYQDMAKMHDEIYKCGYTFDSGLDNQAFGLRPIGVNLNELVGYEDEENDEMKKGGLVAYANDNYETRIATFNNLEEAKKFAKANKHKYESMIFEDEKLDNIVVNKGDTFKDIDFLFSN